jgi:hypothetical protein
VAKLLEDGARRVAISVHYGIPYSRLEHAALSGGSEAKHMAAPEHSGTTSVEAAQHSAAELRRTFARPINPMAAAARARNREVRFLTHSLEIRCQNHGAILTRALRWVPETANESVEAAGGRR